jgi:hypothetical protein
MKYILTQKASLGSDVRKSDRPVSQGTSAKVIAAIAKLKAIALLFCH